VDGVDLLTLADDPEDRGEKAEYNRGDRHEPGDDLKALRLPGEAPSLLPGV
jgi:hypothetical protein